MLIQLTDAGAALIAASTEPIQLTSFKLGSDSGYIPLPSDTDIRGNLIYNGVPSSPSVVSANVVRYSIYLDYDIGPIEFGEAGFFVNNILFALAVSSEPISKTSGDTGSSLRLDAYLSVVGTNYEMWLDYAESNNQFQMSILGSVDQLPSPQNSTPNVYIISGRTSGQSAFQAYTDRLGLWNFDAYQYANRATATVVEFASSSVTINLSDYIEGMSPSYIGEVILQFVTGVLYGTCRYVSNAVISGNNATLSFENPLMMLPITGDQFVIFSRQILSTTIANLPVATTFTLGGIIVGDTLTVKEDGTLNVSPSEYPVTSVNGKIGDVILEASDIGGLAEVALTNQYSSLLGTPAPYVLPIATSTTLGGVRNSGSGKITIAGDGSLDIGFTPVLSVNDITPDASGNVNVTANEQEVIGLVNPAQIVNGTDFNSLQTTGMFYGLDSDASSFLNVPNTLYGGILYVSPFADSANGSDVLQQYSQQNGQFLRRFSVSTDIWTPWVSTSVGNTIPFATISAPGVVQIGEGLSITPLGILSANIQTVNGLTGPDVALNAENIGALSVTQVGTGPDQIVMLDDQARLPAVDGSQLTGISGNTVFPSRAALIAEIDKIQNFQDGTLIFAGNTLYTKNSNSTAINDLPGLEPANIVTPDHWGIVTNVDQTSLISSMVLYAAQNGRELEWGNGEYQFSQIAITNVPYPVFKWSSKSEKTILRSTKTVADSVGFVQGYGVNKATGYATAGVTAGTTEISLPANVVSAIDLENDILILSSTRVIETDDRGEYTHGIVVKVTQIISPVSVQIDTPFYVNMDVGTTPDIIVTAVNATDYQFTCNSLIGQSVSDVRYQLVFQILNGQPSTLACLPSYFDSTTGTFTFAYSSGLGQPTDFPTGVMVGDVLTINRQIRADVYAASKVDIQNITFTRAPQLNASSGDAGFVGLYFQHTDTPIIQNCNFEWFSEAAVQLSNIYNPQVHQLRVRGCNRAYDTTNGTGYAVVLRGSNGGNISNIIGNSCRRIVDIGGYMSSTLNTTSYSVKVNDIVGLGGGTTFTGVPFWPNGIDNQTVAGSHGGSFFSEYTNIKGYQTTGIMVIRGDSERISGVFGVGKMLYMTFIQYGGIPAMENFYYTNGQASWISNLELDSSLTAQGNLQAVIHLDISNTKNIEPLSLSNLTIHGVEQSIIQLINSGTVGPITLGGILDIQTTYGTFSEAPSTFGVIVHTGENSASLSGPIKFGNPTIRNHPANPQNSIIYLNVNSITIPDGLPLYYPDGSIRIYVSDSSVISLPTTGQSVGWLTLRSNNPPGRPQKCAMIALALGAGQDTVTFGLSTGMSFLSTALTGTTGPTEQINASYGKWGINEFPVLQIENRTGERRFLVINFTECF